MSSPQFSFDTIENFDNHINLSVPNYKHITDLVLYMSSYLIDDNSSVYDLGCSTGSLLEKLSKSVEAKNVNYIGYDISDNLLSENREGGIHLLKRDVTERCTFDNASLILSIFTLQFLEIEKRKELLKSIFQSLRKGGALVVTEKCYAESGFIQEMFTFSYYDFKSESFTYDEIFQKQFDLRKIMKPLSSKDNEKLFREAGFKEVHSFFQSLSFYGWVCRK